MKRWFLVLLVAVVFLAACGGGKDSGSTTGTTAGSPSATTLPNGTTATTKTGNTGLPATTAAPATNPPQLGEVTPQAAANVLLQAWEDADATGAQRVADAAALQTLFKTPYQESTINNLQFRGCDNNPAFDNAMACSYQYDGGSMSFVMGQAGTLWRTNSVQFSS